MAETAKLMSPNKKVILPDMDAGCSLSSSITGKDVRLLKEKYPGVPVVSYVNTSAEVKAETESTPTSEINSSEDLVNSSNIREETNSVETELSPVSDQSIETDKSDSSPSNGLENFDFDEETPELFNSDGSISETDEETSLINEVNETKEEEDDLEIPAFLRRQKN